MEITNANAGVMLPYLATQLRDCDYLAVDLEFSGIDRDGAEADAHTPEAIAASLTRKPSDLYPKKLETIKPYSIIQIGLCIFTRSPLASAANTIPPSTVDASHDALRPTVKDLAWHVQEFVPDISAKDYYVSVLQATVQAYEHAAAKPGKDKGTSGWASMLTSVAKETASVGEQMAKAGGGTWTVASSTSTSPFTTSNTVELLHRYHFLEALYRAVARRSREAECIQRTTSAAKLPSQTNAGSPHSPTPATPSPESYRVQTFTAYMFPAMQDEGQNVSLNVDTAEFLVRNNIDLTRWVRDGLRFKPLKSVAAAIAEEAALRLKNLEVLSQPHTALPHFTQRFKNKLDDLLPLTPGELPFIRFVLDLCDAPPSSATTHIVPFYIGATRAFIQFARGEVPESALPDTVYVQDKLFRDEIRALAAMGISRFGRKYGRANNSNGGGSSGGATSADGALTSSVAAHGYGTALMEIVLHATEALRKPIVFYNGYTDLMFLLLALYGPQGMPASLETFKAIVHQHFPVLYDTRVLACASQLQELGNFTGKLSSVVDEMAKVSSISAQVSFRFDELAVGGADPSLSSSAHNAGFDAMLTGKLFAYATRGIQHGGGDYELFLNFLATYSTLLSINLTEKEDGVLQEEPTSVYFLAESGGLRVDAIREALMRGGLTAVVMFRGNGYTIQPVGKACHVADYMQRAEAELSRSARSTITLLCISI